MKAKTKSILKWVAILILLVSFSIVASQLGLKEVFNNLLQKVEGLGFWGPVIFIGAYILSTIFFIPASVLTLGAGAVFGLAFGSIYVSIASTIGASAAFLIGRYFARDLISKKIEGNERFAAIDSAVGKEGWKIVGLTRLSPAFPFTLLNYAYGLTKVPFSHYLISSWIGMMPGTVMYVYLGSLGNAASEGGTSPLEWALRIVGLLATVVVTIYVTKVAKKALDSKLEN